VANAGGAAPLGEQGSEPDVGDDATSSHGGKPFWRTKTLDEMSEQEWESLCDGCGRCCMLKLEDEDTGDLYLTRAACNLLDVGTCRCSNYAERQTLMPDCIAIDPEKVRSLAWLPETCAYRRVEEGRDLEWWHPLISGSRESVHEAGISVRGWAIPEREVPGGDLEQVIVSDYPRPRRRRRR
jgi:uncharacterized cysteine cluster protein YcgN (CxxCxxCC family)